MVRQNLFIALLILTACKGGNQDDHPTGDPGILRFFEGFPEVQFMGIRMEETTDQLMNQLSSKGFDRIEDITIRFENKQEEVEVIVPDHEKVYEMKVFIYNPTDIKEAGKLKDFFTEQAKSSNVKKEFSFFEIDNQHQTFTLTLFEQDEFLRLNYKLKASH